MDFNKKEYKKVCGEAGGGNGKVKIIRDLRKGKGRYTNIHVETYFTNED